MGEREDKEKGQSVTVETNNWLAGHEGHELGDTHRQFD